MTTDGCPLCAPRPDESAHSVKVASLSVSTLYLDRNQAYRGHAVLVFDPRHAVGLESLSSQEYGALSADLRRAAQAIAAVCRPDLMNYASLGNVVPHLHWHLVPRYRDDPRWGGPIYTTTMEEMAEARLAPEDFAGLLAAIRLALAKG
jgi:diadenosine tetraphosphate (Ap4A) HIT family hydrolase